MCDLLEVVNHYLFNYIKKGWLSMANKDYKFVDNYEFDEDLYESF